MSPESIKLLSNSLLYTMQVSVLVPMVIVWRRRQFPTPVKILSWYVYLSAFCALSAKLGAIYLHHNLFFLIGFNVGKVLLFAAVYSLAMPTWKRVLKWTTILGLVIVGSTMQYDMILALNVARVVQCALLAGFALLYMDFSLTHADAPPGSQNPYWLLSVGQLVYSAGTVTGFSLDWIGQYSPFFMQLEMICVALSGFVFNYFLTLAFLRAKPEEPTPQPAWQAAGQLVER